MAESSAKRKIALAISCAAHAVQDGLTTTISILLPVLAETFGFSYAQIGLLKALKSMAQAVFEISSGWLSERVGECRLIVIGLAMAGIGYGLFSVFPGTFVLAASLLVIGVGTALHHAPSSALIVANYPDKGRSSALGIYNASGDIGKLAFSGGVSLAIGMGIAWQQVTLFYGLAALLAAIGITIAATSLTKPAGSTPEPSENADDESTATGWGILDWRSFGTLLVVTSIDTVVQTGVLVFTAFLMLSKGLSLPLATAATVIVLIGGVFGKSACGFLADRIGVRLAFALIQIFTAIGLITITFAPQWVAFVMLLPLGAVVQGSSSITYGFAADLIHPQRMARGYALLYSSGTFAAVAGPPAFGLIADWFGIENAFLTMAILSIAAVPIIFLMKVSPKRAEAV